MEIVDSFKNLEMRIFAHDGTQLVRFCERTKKKAGNFIMDV
jgi:hypothetical protein